VLTEIGKRLLHHARRMRVRIKATFMDAAEHLYTKTAKVELIS
jgi:hypothetical protein